MILKNQFKAKKALLLVYSFLCMVFFQGCTEDTQNNNTGFFYPGGCPIKSVPTLKDGLLCVGIYGCPSRFCSASPGGDFQIVIRHRDEGVSQLQCNNTLANLSLHSCSFGTDKEAKVKSFDVVRKDDGTNTIRLSMAKGAIIEPEEGDENNDKGLRLVSFYSLRCGGYINQNSLLTSGSLYRARLDEDRGSVIISDMSNIVCENVKETKNEAKLECTYNSNAGCVLTLSVWGYDSRGNFSNRKTIAIR